MDLNPGGMEDRVGSGPIDPGDLRAGPEPGNPGEVGVDGEGSRRFRDLLREWARLALVVLLLFFGMRAFVVEAFKIPTSSMENTLLVGDFLLVNKAVYGTPIPGTDRRVPGWADPERGDVIVFLPPHEPDRNYVKRVVGLPGDTIEMREKRVFVNGRPLEEPYARHSDRVTDVNHPSMRWQSKFLPDLVAKSDYRPSRDNWGPIVIPNERYFVLGDNRDNSDDSRYWGLVERTAIRGKPWFVYYSFDPHRGGGSFGWLRNVRWQRIGWRIR